MPCLVPTCNRHSAVVADWLEFQSVMDGIWMEARAIAAVLDEVEVFVLGAATAA